MSSLFLIAFIALVIAPIVVALTYGDRLLDRFELKKAAGKRKRRRQTTLALPLRPASVDHLLRAEDGLQDLDRRIAEAFESFRVITATPVPVEVSEEHLAEIERAVLIRETHFVPFLDLAQIQSVTIELLAREVELLRQLAEVKRSGGPARTPDPEPEQTAADRLRTSLDDAEKRRRQADRKIHDLHQIGRRIDTTIHDS